MESGTKRILVGIGSIYSSAHMYRYMCAYVCMHACIDVCITICFLYVCMYCVGCTDVWMHASMHA